MYLARLLYLVQLFSLAVTRYVMWLGCTLTLLKYISSYSVQASLVGSMGSAARRLSCGMQVYLSRGMWDFSSPAWAQTCALCSGSGKWGVLPTGPPGESHGVLYLSKTKSQILFPQTCFSCSLLHFNKWELHLCSI